MRAVVQRVKKSKVTIGEDVVGRIDKGLTVLLGITEEDSQKDVEYLAEKIVNLRIFEDENEKMNLSLKDIEGELLIVSQFTLYGDCRKGRRPNFMSAAKPDKAIPLYESFIEKCKSYDLKVETGEFGGDMEVKIINDGPVTLMLDSDKTF